MYSYSPIKSVLVKNFRNIGEVTLDFSDSPIISLIGENESGKTSLVKAFGVCAMHCDPRAQKDYIRDGTQGFGVAIELEDGTQVIRIKQGNANRYTVRKADGTVVWDANKLENDVPKAVQDVMGLIEEPETKELLHIRTYEDQLLFVVTPASTNYKVMYDALKISQITKAIKAGSTEANGLKAKISQTDTSVLALNQSLSAIKTFDMEPLLNVKNKLIEERKILDKMDTIMTVMEQRESMMRQLGALRELEESGIKPIDIEEAMHWDSVDRVITEINSLHRKASAYSELCDAESVDVAILSKLNEALDKKDTIHGMMNRSKNFVDLANIEAVSEVELSTLTRTLELQSVIEKDKRLAQVYNLAGASPIETSEIQGIAKIDKAIELINFISTNQGYLGQIEPYLESIIKWMKDVGVSTTTCPKCGEDVIIDIEAVK